MLIIEDESWHLGRGTLHLLKFLPQNDSIRYEKKGNQTLGTPDHLKY